MQTKENVIKAPKLLGDKAEDVYSRLERLNGLGRAIMAGAKYYPASLKENGEFLGAAIKDHCTFIQEALLSQDKTSNDFFEKIGPLEDVDVIDTVDVMDTVARISDVHARVVFILTLSAEIDQRNYIDHSRTSVLGFNQLLRKIKDVLLNAEEMINALENERASAKADDLPEALNADQS